MTEVLIVEDSKFMRNLLKKTLSDEAKYSVVGEAENGKEGVKMFKDLKPDLVLMDIVMPSVNGIKATKKIKSMNDSSKIIMCTSVGQESKMKKAIKAGADDYIVKPFQGPKVLETIEKHV